MNQPARNKRVPYFVWCALAGVAALLFFVQSHHLGFSGGHHGFLSSHGMTLADSVYHQTPPLMFNRLAIDDSGNVTPHTYNRFPVTAFALIGSLDALFPGELSTQILVARLLMNLFAVVTLLFCYLIARRLTGEDMLALASALLAFSSYYVLYYSDMVFNDVPALFGFVLLLWVILRHRESSRYFQLIGGVVLAVSFGWQPLAVLVAWFLVAVLEVFLANRCALSLLRSLWRHDACRMLLLGMLVASAHLGMNLISEWMVTGGHIWELPSLRSAMQRVGLAEPSEEMRKMGERLDLVTFLMDQASKVGVACIPAIFEPREVKQLPALWQVVVKGSLGLGLCIGFATAIWRHRARWQIVVLLLFSAFFWSIPMRGFTAFHNFQALFYITIPVCIYASLLPAGLHRLRWMAPLVAMAILVASLLTVNESKQLADDYVSQVTRDFGRIRDVLGQGQRISLSPAVVASARPPEAKLGAHSFHYYLNGNYFSASSKAKFIIAASKCDNSRLRTPTNIHFFLCETH